jgi:micrococcal nuclease
MQILSTCLAIAVALFQLSPRVSRSESVVVKAVFDGDTIEVSTYGRVRLLGIDAPEVGRGFDTAAPFAHEARDRLAALVLHRWVRLEQDGPAVDAYNRRLAYVMREDGVFVNAALVREGLARVTARVPLARLAELKRAEAEAQTFRRGMWGATPQIPPASYTRPSGARRSTARKHKRPATRNQKHP